MVFSKKGITFAPAFHKESPDPLAQSVEHNTFNVGVLGSNPKRITKERLNASLFRLLGILTQGFFRRFALKASPTEPSANPKHVDEENKATTLIQSDRFQ